MGQPFANIVFEIFLKNGIFGFFWILTKNKSFHYFLYLTTKKFCPKNEIKNRRCEQSHLQGNLSAHTTQRRQVPGGRLHRVPEEQVLRDRRAPGRDLQHQCRERGQGPLARLALRNAGRRGRGHVRAVGRQPLRHRTRAHLLVSGRDKERALGLCEGLWVQHQDEGNGWCNREGAVGGDGEGRKSFQVSAGRECKTKENFVFLAFKCFWI